MAKLLGLFALACLVASAWASEPLRVNHEDIARRYDYRLSLKKPFLFFGTLPSFDLHGHAISSTESIRLTTSVPKMRGSVWAQEPNPYRAWQLHFSLGISGRTYLGDDGIALWYTSQKGVEGPVYGSQDQWKGLGIFFDSSDVNTNRVTPYVSAYLNDGSYEMSLDNNAGSSSIGGCFRDFRNSPKPIWGRLTYANRTLRAGAPFRLI
ncbi:legume-like lectin [Chytridium lagenaria]|nr:legume-like lectin [Chytridium lagenaria]